MIKVESPLRVNLGCGTVAPGGWVNIDSSFGLFLAQHRLQGTFRKLHLISAKQAAVEWPSNIRRYDVTKRLPFADGSTEAVYTSHMLEHLYPVQIPPLLMECRRVLVPNEGVLRIAVPDLRKQAQDYIESDTAGAADEFLRGLGMEESPQGFIKGFLQSFRGSRHRWMYDEASLTALLTSSGFSEIKRWTFREGRCPDLDTLENRPDSLFIEAHNRA